MSVRMYTTCLCSSYRRPPLFSRTTAYGELWQCPLHDRHACPARMIAGCAKHQGGTPDYAIIVVRVQMKKAPPQALVFDPESFRSSPPGITSTAERRLCAPCG